VRSASVGRSGELEALELAIGLDSESLVSDESEFESELLKEVLEDSASELPPEGFPDIFAALGVPWLWRVHQAVSDDQRCGAWLIGCFVSRPVLISSSLCVILWAIANFRHWGLKMATA
jgi:hypothetical protein